MYPYNMSTWTVVQTLQGCSLGAQYSEIVKSRVPSIYFLSKNYDSLVVQEKQARGYRGSQSIALNSPNVTFLILSEKVRNLLDLLEGNV